MPSEIGQMQKEPVCSHLHAGPKIVEVTEVESRRWRVADGERGAVDQRAQTSS